MKRPALKKEEFRPGWFMPVCTGLVLVQQQNFTSKTWKWSRFASLL